MVKSMTGFGSAQANYGTHEIHVEIKSLNSKFADIAVKVPASLSRHDLAIKKLVSDNLQRGKITVVVDIISSEEDLTGVYNADLLRKYYAELHNLAEDLNADSHELFKLALQSPNVMKMTDEQLPEDLINLVLASVGSAVKECDKFRIAEGTETGEKITGYVHNIEASLSDIDQFEGERIERLETRLKDGLKDLESTANIEIDNNRFEQELIYYIEKFDISEEKVRLGKHLSYFREVLGQTEPNGKKLGFIAQEIGREINTIGSKANHADLQRLVVQMKEELEKIKEQVLNIL
jgi:uncharacterized protein (TIGR00255 family)